MAIEKIVTEYRLELEGLKADVNQIKQQLGRVDESVNKSADNTNKKFDEIGGNVSGKLTSAFTKLGGVIAAAFAVERIGDFISSSIELASKAEGIRTAFERLNDPNLLSELRRATKGTVSDLQLMQTAVKAANFKLPLSQLATYLKFAQQRAIETGESIDYLVESIVLGISRKSIPILDNLGISAQQVQDEFKKTGDFAEAVGNIINESMGEAGETILTTAERQAQLRTEIENTKVEIGERLLPVINSLLTGLLDVANAFDKAFQGREGRLSDITDKIAESGMSVEELNSQLAKNRAEIDDILKRYPNVEKVNRTVLALMDAGATKERDRLDSLKLQNQAIEQYVKFLSAKKTTQAEDTEEIEKSTKATEKQTQSVWGLGQALLSLAQHASDPIKAIGGDLVGGVGDARDAFGEARTEAEKLRQALTNLTVTSSESADNMQLTWDDWATAIQDTWANFTVYFNNLSRYREEVLQKELDNGLISQEQFDRESAKLKRKEAIREKAYSILSTTLSTARAVMSALGTVPPNPALAALAAVTGGIQLATIAATPIPAFKDGVIDLKGKGTETSDSNLALLSKGESVITARATRRHKDALEAIQKDKFDDYVMKVYLKQLQGKSKEANNHLDEWLYRSYLAQNKLIAATERQGDKVREAVREIPKRHRFQ